MRLQDDWIGLPLCLLLVASACGAGESVSVDAAPCSPAWNEAVEEALGTGDGRGHGPDVGSAEWKSVIEFKLGVRDAPETPDLDSPQWCDYIDALVTARHKD